jgi:hypothetical protein
MTLIAGLWGTGCGDVGVGALSKADFAAKGNRICEQILRNSKTKTARQASGRRLTRAELNRSIVAGVQREVDALHVLGAPAGEEARVSAMLDLAQKGLDQAHGDPKRLLKPGSPSTAARREAFQLGLMSCAFLL